MFTHLSLRVRIFLFFALLGLGGAGLLVVGLVIGYHRLGEAHALSSFVISGFVGVFAILGLSAWVWTLFDENVARPLERLAADMRARAHADVEDEIDHNPARFLGDLAPAAAAVAAHLTETRNAMALAVGRETARLGLEKKRLETLLAEVPDGVLFCTPDHKIALYNGQARQMFGQTEALGLDRPLAGLIRLEPVRMAYDRLKAGNPAGEGVDILLATKGDARLLEARMRLMRLEGQETANPAYLLSLRDVSQTLAVHSTREALLSDLLDAAQAALTDIPMDRPAHQALADCLAQTRLRKAQSDGLWWPLETLTLGDITSALEARLHGKGMALSQDMVAQTRVRADGFALTRLMERLALAWRGAGASELHLSAEEGSAVVTLTLTADRPAFDQDRLTAELAQPLASGHKGFCGSDVLRSHGARLWADGAALNLQLARVDASGQSADPRLVQYDFDLLHAELPAELSKAPLKNLSYVVFDTETTGLNPAVDEICQIAAIRIVNGRIVEGERFDMLVNPGRHIPAASTAVHHITNDMVANAPSPSEAIARFHRFAAGAVLVAHNAPFDMAFLQRREGQIDARFDQPILDTVLCSAVLFGQSAEHTLDALCTRLGIVIPEADRHTAIGDALGTAEAMRKMLPMLDATGIKDLGGLIAAFDRHARLLQHLN